MYLFYELYILSSLFSYGTLGLVLLLSLALLSPWMYRRLKFLIGAHHRSSVSGLSGLLKPGTDLLGSPPPCSVHRRVSPRS